MVELAPELTIAGLAVGEKVSETDSLSEDAQLVAKAREGDEAAFRDLVEKYRQLAYHTAYGFLRDAHLARDVSQETFVRVYNNLDSYDPKRPFGTWMRRIAVNLSIDELRRKRRRSEIPLEHTVSASRTDTDPVHRAELSEEQAAVWRVLDKLPVKYRTVMVLREIEGLSTREVAEITGKPEVSVRWRLHRARKLFRDEWMAQQEEEAKEE